MGYRINVLGAGPVGMYVAALLKNASPETDVQLFEQHGKERLQEGIGYVFVDRMFDALGLLNSRMKESVKEGNPIWNTVRIIDSSSAICQRVAKFPSQGVTRSKLMSALEAEVITRDIPLHYRTSLTAANFVSYCNTDLTIVATGVKRFLSDEMTIPFHIYEAEIPLKYAWFSRDKPLDMHTLQIGKLGTVPFVMNIYPVSSRTSAFVVEVPEHMDTTFCFYAAKTDMKLTPDCFSQVRLRSAVNPFFRNVILLGDAGCTPYFCTGAGLNIAFYTAQKLVHAIFHPEGTLTQRLTLFSRGQGEYYVENLRDGLAMTENKTRVFSEFDSLLESDKVKIITGRALES